MLAVAGLTKPDCSTAVASRRYWPGLRAIRNDPSFALGTLSIVLPLTLSITRMVAAIGFGLHAPCVDSLSERGCVSAGHCGPATTTPLTPVRWEEPVAPLPGTGPQAADSSERAMVTPTVQ